MPAISVIIPVYCVEPYIARCLRSLFGQTLKDLEFVFVDDCTPDSSMDILRDVLDEFPERKKQVKCIRTPQNLGLARARLFGVAQATGDYIAHCDSDDYLALDSYRLMYEKAVVEGLDLVSCDFWLLGLKKSRIQSQASIEGREVADILSGKVWGSVWCRLFKRELWMDMELPKGFDMWEDIVFTIQAIRKAGHLGHIAMPLYYYCRRNSSISFKEGLGSAIMRWESIYANARQVLGFLSAGEVEKGDLLAFKYRCRYPLVPYVQNREYYHKWCNTFPEIDSLFLCAKGIPLGTKFWFILIHLHLYYPWKRVSSFLRCCFSA